MSKADGRDDGSVMGEMKGGMKNVEPLYLKGLTLSDGRDERNYELGVKS